MTGWIQVTVTFGDEATARRLAAGLVRERLAACVQLTAPIYSTFWWDGRINSKQEWQCHAKTTTDRYDALERYVLAQYQADTPEITAVPIVRGSADYLEWIRAETDVHR